MVRLPPRPPNRSRSIAPGVVADRPSAGGGLARLLELVSWSPLRHRRRIRHPQADHQVELGVLHRAGEIPVAVVLVRDLVVVAPLEFLLHLLSPARRASDEVGSAGAGGIDRKSTRLNSSH